MDTDTEATLTPEPAADFEHALADWCRDRSAVDKRVELLTAFYRHEVAAGRVQASLAAFDQRFEDFANAPA